MAARSCPTSPELRTGACTVRDNFTTGVYILANSLLFGKGNNSAKIEIGEEIKEGTITMCA